eukprot:m.63012 g.63012  ORF g.63012 m.63012 type:complete len:587 (-) comp13946_c0_seq1:92-1852(-)
MSVSAATSNALPQQDLPPGWKAVNIAKEVYFIYEKLKLASQTLPKSKKMKRSTKVSLESGTYIVTPKPQGLSGDWEQAIALNPDGQTGVLLYHNVTNGSTHKEDPRQSELLGGDPLPDGWTLGFDADGDMFFIDHNSGTTTYDDPRMVCVEVVSSSAERIAEQATSTRTDELHSAMPATESTTVWKIAKIQLSKFNELPQYLTSKDKLPAEVVGKNINRYINILPNPRTRVRLEDSQTTDAPDTSYINANYISGYNSQPREYIAAMGPLDATIEAFWRMVWMVKSPAIVMTTPLMEQGRVKCARYWPTVKYNEAKKCGDKVYGGISVAVTDGQRQPGYILTHLRLRKGKEEHILRHYWFQNWPDHGVPTSEGAQQVVDMMKEVKAYCKTAGGGPPIVHCSAGIGRTGTFIAIDQAIQSLEATGEVDCLDVVENMRKNRGGMVQHPQQYEFVVKACVQHATATGQAYFICDPSNPDEGPPPEIPARSGSNSSGSSSGSNWKSTMKSKKPQVMAEFIAKGKPPNMPEAEWQKLNRKYRKNQASVRAASSMRRNMDEAELHGELRLGTLSGGTNDGKYRPTAQKVFEQK